ncbi:uncharacterized protein K452DRAFT_155374 [Aplosporella prunicola CBS 121167]|uniref:Uncharacterized protein n=1 Tax=Aplosporella prunicola CBS 121167 TaxID=1176127 RepID=A0A6A6BJA8_9PEZI|nr:uncharacterized protein K452DRAFT_155374 [Aplosporella prunicola CBS 121167]KAF2144250.1 hypothetical protein K452DRAFT_155374 [Aplosporella prunicola CBS 121167]
MAEESWSLWLRGRFSFLRCTFHKAVTGSFVPLSFTHRSRTGRRALLVKGAALRRALLARRKCAPEPLFHRFILTTGLCIHSRRSLSARLRLSPSSRANARGWRILLFRVHLGLDFADYLGRIPCDDVEGRYALGDNAGGANGAAAPDGHAGQDAHAAADPAVLPDVDFLAELGAVGAVAEEGIERVGAAVEGDVGTDEGARADGHQARVEDGAAVVDVHILAQLDIGAVVHVYGGLNPSIVFEEIFVGFGRGCWWGERGSVANDAEEVQIVSFDAML